MFYKFSRVLRLYFSQTINHRKFTNARINDDEKLKKGVKITSSHDHFLKLLRNYKEKITFNSFLEDEKLRLGPSKYFIKQAKEAKKNQVRDFENKKLNALPVALKYYVDKDRLLTEETEPIVEPQNKFQLPFAKPTTIETDPEETELQKKLESFPKIEDEQSTEFQKLDVETWMTNYEHFDDTLLEDSDDEFGKWTQLYGQTDPTAKISNVQCGGCGALLHCNDSAIPGYLPSEIFKGRTSEELKTIECQRCHFLKEYNIALDVSVQPEEYETLLQSLRHVKALVVLMVDLLDFPCSIWPGIVDIIGYKRPIIVVGNKVDLLPGDSIGYLKRIKESLETELLKTKLKDAKIRHIELISAKTGYGVEELINKMFKVWEYKGDVFLVGCTNVGKSSLFNALLQSDYCKVQAVDIIKRATISRWPGTTLNLLKFPITRPTGWRLHVRSKRLKRQAKDLKLEKEIRAAQTTNMPTGEAPALIGHIGRSFTGLDTRQDDATIAEKKYKLMTLDEKADEFRKSHWLYDTPGVIHPDQILSLLSTEELLLTIPKKLIRTQTYYLFKDTSIFIGGLARIDVIESESPCRLTIFCSESLPITVTKTEDADEIYKQFVGTELFAVPRGDEERLSHWPGLQASEDVLTFEGEGPKRCCGDIVLSSVAFVGVTAKGGTSCVVRAWTPHARGIHRRFPSVLPYAVNLKGKRLRDSPAYMRGTVFRE